MKYSLFTILYRFQVYSIVIQYFYNLCSLIRKWLQFTVLYNISLLLIYFNFSLSFRHPIWCFPSHFLSLYWICYNIASVSCFDFFGPKAHGILAPWPGIKPALLALEREILTTGLPGESLSPRLSLLHLVFSPPLHSYCSPMTSPLINPMISPQSAYTQYWTLLISPLSWNVFSLDIHHSSFLPWLCHAPRGILLSPPGIKPAPSALEAQSLTHWTTREVQQHSWFSATSPTAPSQLPPLAPSFSWPLNVGASQGSVLRSLIFSF